MKRRKKSIALCISRVGIVIHSEEKHTETYITLVGFVVVAKKRRVKEQKAIKKWEKNMKCKLNAGLY